jgi:hypothetical protein
MSTYLENQFHSDNKFQNMLRYFLTALSLINITANAQQNNSYYYNSGPQNDELAEVIIPQHLGNAAYAKQDSADYSVIRNAKTAKIIVSQDYVDATKINLPIEKMMVAFLKNANISEDTINDLIIRVRLHRSGLCYSGANIYCSLNIVTLNGEKFSDQFDERISPPSSIAGQYPSPDDAPYNEVYRKVKKTLLKILYVPFGIEPFLNALTDQNEETTHEVIEILGSFNDKRAVEPLIQIITTNKNEYVVKAAIKALGDLRDTRAAEPMLSLLEKEKATTSRGLYDDLIKALIKTTGINYDPNTVSIELTEAEYHNKIWIDYLTNNFPGYTIYRAYMYVPSRNDTEGTIIYRILTSNNYKKDLVMEFTSEGTLINKW